MNVIPIENLADYIARTLEGVTGGIRQAGSVADVPDAVNFDMVVLFKANAIERIASQDSGITVQTSEQLEDTVTTHGRTQTEGRDNRGGSNTIDHTNQETYA